MNRFKPKYLQAAILLAGIVFASFGAFRGEAETVLAKAIKICLECIGIG